MDFLDRFALKVASAFPRVTTVPLYPDLDADQSPVVSPKPPAIVKLLAAKHNSDQKRYPEKHEIVRQMILSEPDSFVIDSEDGGIVGLTHRSGFRIHMPRKAMPTIVLQRKRPKLTSYLRHHSISKPLTGTSL